MSEFSYSMWPSAPCVCRNDPRDFIIRDGDLVHFVLADALPFASMVGFSQGANLQPSFVYPAAVLTYRNPDIYGKVALHAPQSIISVECLNLASMYGMPIQGEIRNIDDLLGNLQLGGGKIGRFEGESRELYGDFDDTSDFEGMVEALLAHEGISAGRDASEPPPFMTFANWLARHA